MPEVGRTLIVLGLLLVVAGGAVLLLSRAGIPFGLGRLPGDVVIKRDAFTLYLPITTSIVVSLVLSLVLYLLRR